MFGKVIKICLVGDRYKILNDFCMGRYRNMQNADLKDRAIRKYCVTSCDI